MIDQIFAIDLKRLGKAKERGHCLCEVNRNADGSNVCPCRDFLQTLYCKCRVYANLNCSKEGERIVCDIA